MSKYIDADQIRAEIERQKEINKKVLDGQLREGCLYAFNQVLSFLDTLQQENEIVEFTFKGGTYRMNGEEHAFKGGKAKVIILEINQEEGNE